MSFTDFADAQLLGVLSALQMYLQLHLGPPGRNGGNNATPSMGRAPVHFSTPTGSLPALIRNDGDTAANGNAVAFPAWVGSVFPIADFVSHWSIWDAATAGNCWATGSVGGMQPLAALCNVDGTIETTVDHNLSAADALTLSTYTGLSLPAPLARDTFYFVSPTGLTANAFNVALTDDPAAAVVDIAANGACIVEKVIPKLVNSDDLVRFAVGEITVYLE